MRRHEFYTPSHVIEIARACMGGIDLDPASCAAANETVRAATFYSIKDDGLKQPWFGRVWLNPPFWNLATQFVRKAVEEIKAGRIDEVIILLKANAIPTGWFNAAMDVEHFICTPKKRISFNSPIFVTTSASFPSVLVGVGIGRERFNEHFGKLGKIAAVAASMPATSRRTPAPKAQPRHQRRAPTALDEIAGPDIADADARAATGRIEA